MSVGVYETKSGGVAGVPAAALPGITVLGNGERSGKPDGAIVRLGLGSGSSFSDDSAVELVDEKDIEAVVDALKREGGQDISVDRFGATPYGPLAGAAQITFKLGRPDRIEKVLERARDVARRKTDYSIQSASVVFTVSDCERLEDQAWKAALDDAKRRAGLLARRTNVSLGAVLAVSEASTSPTPYGPATTGCEALRPQAFPSVQTDSVENTPEEVEIAVTLQVTYAIDRG